MNKVKEQDILISREVIEMITVANEYCLFIEKSAEYEMTFIIEYLQKVLPLIYLKGALLPTIDVQDNSANERYVTEEHWEEVFRSLRNVFGEKDIFFTLPHYSDESSVPIKASLSENLTDIYQDMKDFILLYQKTSRDAKENAIDYCRYLFVTHWGEKILKVLDTIHIILVSKDDNDDEDEFLY